MVNLNTKVVLRVVNESQGENPSWEFVDACFRKSEIIGISQAKHDEFEFEWEFSLVYLSSGVTLKVLENYQELYDWFESL